MKTLREVSLGLLLCILVGCDRQEASGEAGFSDSYEIVEELEFDHHWSSVRRLKIRGQGTHNIAIGDGGRGGVELSPDEDPANEIVMVFMVDPGKRVATWWITDFSRDPEGGISGRAGSPRSFTYSQDAKYLTEVVEFPRVEGQHALGEKVPLVRFLDPTAGETQIDLIIR